MLATVRYCSPSCSMSSSVAECAARMWQVTAISAYWLSPTRKRPAALASLPPEPAPTSSSDILYVRLWARASATNRRGSQHGDDHEIHQAICLPSLQV